MMISTLFSGKRVQDWLLLLLALGLFSTPWLAGFRAMEVPTWHAWVMAFLLAYLALAALSEARQWEEWVTLGLGLWLIVAPWVLRFSSDTAPERAHWLVGGLVIVISLAAEWRFRHARTS
ncbi:SPW repeat protein [Labrys sp. 22185]|uniref:SPW repeat protein n=1 Tax=Labrys sp. 22185 TaxID=3453888 RepID=UPI003F85EC24